MRKLFLTFIGTMIASQVALAESKNFKMYREPFAKVNVNCDIYTKLVLEVDGNTAFAKLSDHVGGFCEIHVDENKRSYQLAISGTDCGTKIYQQDAVAEVVDNRGRRCENMIPALIVLKEYDQNGNESVLYSKDY